MSDQVEQHDPNSDWLTARSGRSADGEQALKSLAKNLARAAADDIADRHVRARVRTRCYNQTLTLLRQFDSQRASDRRRQQRIVTVAGSVTALLCATLAAVTLI